jgi:exopolyphosphatase
LRGVPPLTSFTIVLGNPSADLDSFISAVVYAYFCSASFRKDDPKPWFIPVLNLPTTPARDLWRLRPEFATALKLAEGRSVTYEPSGAVKDENNRVLLEQLVTISDIHSASKSTPVSLFSHRRAHSSSVSSKMDDYVLVDHNALTIPTLSAEDVNRHVNVTGCIDHHVDESFVPSNASPRIIKTGIGSCTSLVVQHLRDLRLWPLPDEGYATGELARLALAPILMDTANLTAEGKVSDTDRDAVAFLESCIQSTSTSGPGPQEWDRKSFYHQIANTKANSLDLLTFPEIFERDYKEWTEATRSGEELNIGVSSIRQTNHMASAKSWEC